MTVVDATCRLFDWFSKNHYLSLDKNFQQIMVISVEPEEDKACLRCALEEFEKLEFVRASETKGKKIWVLKKAFQSFEQNVLIPYESATVMAEIINTFCETINDSTDQCDPTNITKKDIKNILIICQHMAKELQNRPATEK